MQNKKKNKNKASVNYRKLSLDNKTKENKKQKNSKVISDSEEEKDNKIRYPKEDNSYDSLSTDKTEEIYNKANPNKNDAKSVKKNIKKNNKKRRQSTTVVKTQKINNKKTFVEDYDEGLHFKKKRNRKNKEVDIEMRDETLKNENKFKISSLNSNYLPCREKEQEIIYNYIKKGLETNGNYNSLYLAGMPGTGKTACVNNVINLLEEELKNKDEEKLSFTKLYLCGTEFPVIKNIYKTIFNFIFSSQKKIKRKNYIQKLDNFFKYRDKEKIILLNDPTNSHIILIVDEIDYLINRNQNLLYNLFNWTTYESSKLIVISISNTLDLPEHLLPKIKSRMGNNKLMFKPYNKDQLIEIIKSKDIDYDKFNPDAIKLCCMKVSAINGDLRRTIQILLRAKELFNLETTRKSLYKKIDKNYIIKACDDLFNSKLRKVLESLQICEKIILCAILSKIKDIDNNKVNLGQLYDKIDIFFNKYNEKIAKNKIELYWEEYKQIIYNLIRLKLLSFSESQKLNFMENFVTIKFYIDEFIVACDGDKNLKPVLDYLTNLISA